METGEYLGCWRKGKEQKGLCENEKTGNRAGSIGPQSLFFILERSGSPLQKIEAARRFCTEERPELNSISE